MTFSLTVRLTLHLRPDQLQLFGRGDLARYFGPSHGEKIKTLDTKCP